MKRLLLVLGIIITILSFISLAQYFTDYKELSEYGKGFVWGKSLILIAGIIMIYFGSKRS